MLAITIEEILGHIESFENSVTELFEHIHDETHDEGVRLLTDYIGRHRHRTFAELERCCQDEIERIKKLPLQYQPDIPGEHTIKEVQLSADASPLEILKAAIEFDESMVKMYKQIASQPLAHEVKELFEGLTTYETVDEIHLKEITHMFSR
jgi:hypothetical protein